MLKPIDGMPSNVVAIEAVGEVDAGDYKSVLDPALEAALATSDKIRFLYVLGDDFTGYSGGAMWEDTKAGVGHWNRWEKIALVTDNHTYHNGVKAVAWLVPGEVKLYTMTELDDAKAWISS
jgi:hypothetical protein